METDTPIGDETARITGTATPYLPAPPAEPANVNPVSAVEGVIRQHFKTAEERVSAVIDDLTANLKRDLLGS